MTITNNNAGEKEQYFNTLFESKVIKYGQSTNGQFVSTKIICSNRALDSLFNKLYKDYKVKESWHDYYNECVYWTYMAIIRFEIKDGKSWSGIIEGTDKANTGRLIKSIQITVKNEIYRYVNDGAKFTRGEIEVDGKMVKGQHVTLKFDISSLDALLSASTSNEETVVNLISEEQNFFKAIDLNLYQISYFAKWFRENKAKFLEPSQLVFLGQLEKVRKIDGYTINDTEEVFGISNSAVNSRLRRIKNRVAGVYLKQNVNGYQNRLQQTVNEELELWNSVLDIINGEELIKQNENISNWILQNAEVSKVANILYDNINLEQSIELTKAFKKGNGKLSTAIIYTFVEAVFARVNDLKNTNTTVTEVTKAPNYKAKGYQAMKKDWDCAPVVVFDLEGEFKRMEAVKPVKRKMNIQIVMPSGIQLSI